MLVASLLTLYFTREHKLCEHRDLTYTATLNIQHLEHTLAENKHSVIPPAKVDVGTSQELQFGTRRL